MLFVNDYIFPLGFNYYLYTDDFQICVFSPGFFSEHQKTIYQLSTLECPRILQISMCLEECVVSLYPNLYSLWCSHLSKQHSYPHNCQGGKPSTLHILPDSLFPLLLIPLLIFLDSVSFSNTLLLNQDLIILCRFLKQSSCCWPLLQAWLMLIHFLLIRIYFLKFKSHGVISLLQIPYWLLRPTDQCLFPGVK